MISAAAAEAKARAANPTTSGQTGNPPSAVLGALAVAAGGFAVADGSVISTAGNSYIRPVTPS
jgi:hypothetical protein